MKPPEQRYWCDECQKSWAMEYRYEYGVHMQFMHGITMNFPDDDPPTPPTFDTVEEADQWLTKNA